MLVGINLECHQTKGTDVEIKDEMAHLLQEVATSRCKRAYTKIFSYFAPRLRSFALKQSTNEAMAVELVQDTLANVWQKAHLFNPEKGNASTWIFTIARNIRYDLLRRQMNRKEDLCSDDLWPVLCEQTAHPLEQSLEHKTEMDEIESLFQLLPEKQRQVIDAIYIQGKSQQEVADELAIPLGTVKSRTRLALQRLREILNAHD